VADANSEPFQFQTNPSAAPDVVEADGKLGAINLYFLSPQMLVTTDCIVMEAGADGALNKVLVNFKALSAVLPHAEVYWSNTLSPMLAAELLAKVIKIF
jgi:hypothetical protein